jgi:hypothetical protein
MLRKYGKALAAVVTAAVVVAYQALSGDNRINPDEWVAVAIAATTAVGVWLVPLVPAAMWTKTAVAAVLAVLQVLTTVILGGLDSGEWLLLFITAAGALGIYLAPAETELPGVPDVAVDWGSDA